MTMSIDQLVTLSSNTATVVVASAFAAHIALTPLATTPQWPSWQPKITYAGAGSTFSDHGVSFSNLALPSEHLTLVSFYSKLLSQQEDLGSDFEKILFDNLWDLYSR